MRKGYILVGLLFIVSGISNPFLGEIGREAFGVARDSWKSYWQSPKLPLLAPARIIAVAPIGEPKDVPSRISGYDPFANAYDPFADSRSSPGDCCQPAKRKRSAVPFTGGYATADGGFGDPGTCCALAKPKARTKSALAPSPAVQVSAKRGDDGWGQVNYAGWGSTGGDCCTSKKN